MSTCITCTNFTPLYTNAEYAHARLTNTYKKIDMQCKGSACNNYTVSVKYLITPHSPPCDRYKPRDT